jgi:D-alanine--poly(phosphoribitol) ligase subunit 1
MAGYERILKKYALKNSRTFADRLFETADRFPDRPSFWIDGTTYTYSEFTERVNKIENLLQNSNIKGKRIGLWTEHDINTYAALFAISLAGCTYVPLNINHPVKRLKNIMEQSGVKDIICPLDLVPELKPEEYNLISIKTGKELFENDKIIAKKPFSSDEAVIIFTSGTTNEPKGVILHHTGLNSMLDHFIENTEYLFSEEDRFLQVFDLSFDFSIFSLMIPISIGACCYILPQKNIKPFDMIRVLEEVKITVVAMVPNVLQMLRKYLKEIHLPSLRYTFFGGDALHQDLAVRWKKCSPNAEIINVYGPTESSVICSTYLWEEKSSAIDSVDGIVPLGKMFSDINYLIVNDQHMPVKDGETGELCICGTQIIHSYLDPAQNENKFFEHELNGIKKRFYKTSDLASRDKKGNLIFHGRKDRQVKVNGFRIELSELDHWLYLANGRAVYSMLIKEPVTETNQIISFAEKNILNEKELIDTLNVSIPTYMTPRKIIVLDELPYNANGKIDHNQLKEKWIAGLYKPI